MAALPTGTVTFLFTDIEGSTALLQRLGDRRYTEVLTEHHRLLREAFAKGSGHEIDTQGDAFLVAFPRARDAVATAVVAQQALTKHPWPEGASFRVRMGVHTGEPVSGTRDYVGLDVHRAARICSAGHGSQILLSQTVADLAAPDLPPGASLRDLGAHRLKDLKDPEHLFQVLHPELVADFPPLKSLDARPNNLPIQLTSFIGREREIAEVKRLLGAARLVTLAGSGGAGKTRLALQVAADVVEGYRDGVWLVEFAPIADTGLVPKTVASALGVPEQPSRNMTDTLVDVLRLKALLLVLDNCEHLTAACRDITVALLRKCPHVRILATSREGLGVPGEALWRVPSLSLPDIGRVLAAEDLVLYEAIRLFVDRAVATTPEFAVTSGNAFAVAQVCQRLDGIPLAIELAAARVKVLAVEQIAARLDDRFRLLTGGSPIALARHQTLRAAIDWSYHLLSETERVLLRRLSTFAGGWSLEAAEAVCTGGYIEAGAILDLLSALVDKSLVVVEMQRGEARYRLLETVRQYARDRLLEAGEEAYARSRHRDWCLDLAERAEPKLRGPEQGVWGERLETERDNLRAALEWSKVEEGGAEAWLRLAGALHWFWFMRGYVGEGLEWLEAALAASRNISAPMRAKALCGAGLLAWRQGELTRAEEPIRESLALFRELKDTWGIAFSLHQLAHVQKDYREQAALFKESLARFRETGDSWGAGLTLSCMGLSALSQGEYGQASAVFEESLTIWRELGDQSELATVLRGLGIVAERQGDNERATVLLEEGLALARQVGSKHQIPYLQVNLGNVLLRQGHHERAMTLFRESLVLLREMGDKPPLARSLEGLARVACAQGHDEHAVRTLGAADALRVTTGFQRDPFQQADHDHCMASMRASLGDAAFTAAWAEGRAMTLEQAIEHALAEEAG